MNKITPIMILALLDLTGCSMTPYQAIENGGFPAGGYSEEKLSDNRYFVTFSGNGHSDMEKVKEYWDKRANELCPNGFAIVNSNAAVHAVEHESSVLVPITGIPVPIPMGTTYKFGIPHKYGTIECLDKY
jgi:hypothetical protein